MVKVKVTFYSEFKLNQLDIFKAEHIHPSILKYKVYSDNLQSLNPARTPFILQNILQLFKILSVPG